MHRDQRNARRKRARQSPNKSVHKNGCTEVGTAAASSEEMKATPSDGTARIPDISIADEVPAELSVSSSQQTKETFSSTAIVPSASELSNEQAKTEAFKSDSQSAVLHLNNSKNPSKLDAADTVSDSCNNGSLTNGNSQFNQDKYQLDCEGTQRENPEMELVPPSLALPSVTLQQETKQGQTLSALVLNGEDNTKIELKTAIESEISPLVPAKNICQKDFYPTTNENSQKLETPSKISCLTNGDTAEKLGGQSDCLRPNQLTINSKNDCWKSLTDSEIAASTHSMANLQVSDVSMDSTAIYNQDKKPFINKSKQSISLKNNTTVRSSPRLRQKPFDQNSSDGHDDETSSKMNGEFLSDVLDSPSKRTKSTDTENMPLEMDPIFFPKSIKMELSSPKNIKSEVLSPQGDSEQNVIPSFPPLLSKIKVECFPPKISHTDTLFPSSPTNTESISVPKIKREDNPFLYYTSENIAKSPQAAKLSSQFSEKTSNSLSNKILLSTPCHKAPSAPSSQKHSQSDEVFKHSFLQSKIQSTPPHLNSIHTANDVSAGLQRTSKIEASQFSEKPSGLVPSPQSDVLPSPVQTTKFDLINQSVPKVCVNLLDKFSETSPTSYTLLNTPGSLKLRIRDPSIKSSFPEISRKVFNQKCKKSSPIAAAGSKHHKLTNTKRKHSLPRCHTRYDSSLETESQYKIPKLTIRMRRDPILEEHLSSNQSNCVLFDLEDSSSSSSSLSSSSSSSTSSSSSSSSSSSAPREAHCDRSSSSSSSHKHRRHHRNSSSSSSNISKHTEHSYLATQKQTKSNLDYHYQSCRPIQTTPKKLRLKLRDCAFELHIPPGSIAE